MRKNIARFEPVFFLINIDSDDASQFSFRSLRLLYFHYVLQPIWIKGQPIIWSKRDSFCHAWEDPGQPALLLFQHVPKRGYV